MDRIYFPLTRIPCPNQPSPRWGMSKHGNKSNEWGQGKPYLIGTDIEHKTFFK